MIEAISRPGYAFLRYLATRLLRIDLMLLALVVTLTTIGFIALFSAGYSFPWRIEGQIRNIAVAGVVMLVVSCIPVKAFQKATVPIFIVGCVLLLLTHFFGVTVKGATRWLNVGVRIQPSELMKLAVPMMLAWYYNVRGENVCNWDHLTAFIIMAVPVGLIVKQPDLGTSILVLIAGASVIFFAGLSKRILVSLTGILILSMPVIWSLMHDYQRQRVLTLLDPSADPLGKGFHILQALIAIYDNCNSLHTNAYDEAITTPTEESVRRAMAIQLIINREWGVAKNENPNQGAFIIDELTDLVEEAVLKEFEAISSRGGVLGAMETGFQRGKIQEESLYYEHKKHDGSYPIIGVNTFLNPKGMAQQDIELARSSEDEKQSQLARLADFHARNAAEAPEWLAKLKQTVIENGNVFAVLVDAVKYCSLGQITTALYDVGGQYRRSM